MPGEASIDRSQISTVPDYIRSLRDQIPSEPFSDTFTPPVHASHSSTSPELPRAPNVDATMNGNAPGSQPFVPQLRSPPSIQHLPRPAPYSALNCEDLTLTPKERLKAFLAPNTPTAIHGTSTQEPPALRRQDPSLPDSSGQLSSSSPRSAMPALTNSSGAQSSSPATPVKAAASPGKPTIAAGYSPLTATMSSKSAALPSSSIRVGKSGHSPSLSIGSSIANETAESTSTDGSGSAEAPVQASSKDKQALVSRNEQLWKLVEKQRTMILGLNQDLERAVKDRDRYRRRLNEKEKVIQVLSEAAVTSKAKLLSNASPSRPAEAQPIQMNQKALVSMPSIKQSPSPSASEAIFKPSSQRSPVPDNDLQEVRSTPRGLPLRQEYHDASAEENSQQAGPAPCKSPGESKRKAPPQPLIFAQTQKSDRPQIVEEAVDSESDYEDGVSSHTERGRQKTREDDDRLREVAFQEEERRSRSNKEIESKSKSKSKSMQSPESDRTQVQSDAPKALQQATELPAGLMGGFGLPTSPRAALLGSLQSPLQPTHGSISSALQPTGRNLARAPNASQNLPQYAENPLKSPGLPLKSPGLPMSPRPEDRPGNALAPRLPIQHLAGPGPMSPRSNMILSPRAPRQPLPLPPSTPLAVSSPHVARAEQYALQQSNQSSSTEWMQLREATEVHRDEAGSDAANLDRINRGLVSDQYPEFLLPPNALPLIEVKVDSSRLRPSRNSYQAGKTGEEDSIFTLAVHSRSNGEQLWRVEKALISLPVLDQSLRKSPDFNAKLPDRNLFIGHAPARIDLRRAALNQYFAATLDIPLDEKAALAVCDFFSIDVIGPRSRPSPAPADVGAGTSAFDERRRKEGYLAKKGKQLGGWKARYFVLDGSELRYFEGPNGGHLGNIKLRKAQIARQTVDETAEDAEYRHAFMILEPKRKGSASLVRHVLCAESDEERDGWVNALLAYVENGDDGSGKPRTSKQPHQEAKSSHHGSEQHSTSGSLHSLSYDQTLPADVPTLGSSARTSGSPSPVENTAEFGTPSVLSPADRPNISGPVAGGPIQNSQAWGNKSPSLRDGDYKKRNIFGFRSRPSEDSTQPQQQHQQQKDSRVNNLSSHNGRPVFGISLSEAAEFFAPDGVDICLPAPIYRCIEYLEAKNCRNEEGIFRMSGSNVVIKQIKERFNSEGDVNLLEGQSYDMHAVASLLKLYLRELPESVLTRELHLDFLKVLESEGKIQKAGAVNILAHKLPEANFELLATLSRFLIDIVNNADVNKMNVRNVGIVFAPTLNIPAPLISLFLTDHATIFGNAISASSLPISSSLNSTIASSGSAGTTNGVLDLRSPRKQMFTDLATPAYNQTNFSPQIHGESSNVQSRQQHLNKADFDIGFYPVQRPYEPSQSVTSAPLYRVIPKPGQPPDSEAGGFGSLNAAMASTGPARHLSSTEQTDL